MPNTDQQPQKVKGKANSSKCTAGPSTMTAKLKIPSKGAKNNNQLNIGDAINKKDLLRIRSGSPGLRAGQKKDQLANGKSFQGEMHHHGMASDLQEI